MKSFLRAGFAAALVIAGGAAVPAGETTYYVGYGEKFVDLTFTSHTEVEEILGNTKTATGEVVIDMDKGEGSVKLTVPVAKMTTGIEKRDEHMRTSTWLDAEKFPDITFVSTKAVIDKKKNTAEVTGDFTMHGVKKEITVTVEWKTLTPELAKKAGLPEGAAIKFTTAFEVKLADYGVVIAGQAKGKVSEVWKIKLTTFASSVKPPEEKKEEKK